MKLEKERGALSPLCGLTSFMLLGLTCIAGCRSTRETPSAQLEAGTSQMELGDAGAPPPDGGQPYLYQPPDPSVCDATLDTEHGWLCALQPSRLDSAARDIFAEGELTDETLGFGYHVIAFPHVGAEPVGVYVHFTGSFGRPYHQGSGRFLSRLLLDEAMAAGFVVLQPAYHNRFAVNSPRECRGAIDVDNCAGLVRQEKLTGEDLSDVTEVPVADAIEPRIRALASYLDSVGFEAPVPLVTSGEVQWQRLRLGGHSQGSGHALYISKYFGSEHTCLLGGAYDVPDSVPMAPRQVIADWYLDDSAMIDRAQLRALLSVDDDNYREFVIAYDVLGLEEGLHWSSFSAPSYTDSDGESVNGHSAVVQDPAFRSQRHEACFSDSSR